MKVLNTGKKEPVLVLLGDLSHSEIKGLGGVLLGKYSSKVFPNEMSTWISFESFFKVTDALKLIDDKNKLKQTLNGVN